MMWVLCHCLLDVRVCVCVFDHGACLQSLTPGVSPQAFAGGEEESEEGGGSTAAHLLEALRQFRLHHRGQYRAVLEESLATYQVRGESAAEGTGASRRTSDGANDGQKQPASPPSPPSPPPSPATAEPEASKEAPIPELNPSSDWAPRLQSNPPSHLSLRLQRSSQTRCDLSPLSCSTEFEFTHRPFLVLSSASAATRIPITIF